MSFSKSVHYLPLYGMNFEEQSLRSHLKGISQRMHSIPCESCVKLGALREGKGYFPFPLVLNLQNLYQIDLSRKHISNKEAEHNYRDGKKCDTMRHKIFLLLRM